MDKIKKTVAQLEESLDVINRCIEEVKYEASLNNMEPEHLVHQDGSSKMAGLITTKTWVLVKLLEAYVLIKEEDKEEMLAYAMNDAMDTINLNNSKFNFEHALPKIEKETEEIHLPPQSIMERRYDLTKNRPRPWQHTAKLYLPKRPVRIMSHGKELGVATEFRRDLSGHISAYVMWHDESYDQHIVNGQLDWIVTYGNVKVEDMTKWPMNVLEGRLISLSLAACPGFPKVQT